MNMDENEVREEGPLGIAELVYGVLFTPVSTFRKIAGEPPLFNSFVIFLAVVIMTSLVSTLVTPDLPGVAGVLGEAFQGARPLLGIIGALFAFAGWFVRAGILQVFAEIFSGRGKAVAVLAVIALADIPRVLVIPFQIISHYAAGSILGSFLTVAASLTVFVWSLGLIIIGLREVHGFSTGRAVATLLVPFASILLIIVIFIITTIGLIAPLIQGA